MIQRIHETLERILIEKSIDRRTCFTEVRAEPPDGSRIVVESSDLQVLEETRRRLPVEAVEGVSLHFVELPDPREAFPEVLVASGSVADVRRSPDHAAELVTQVVCGDVVCPLKNAGDWVLVRLDDGYVGWIRGWHLAGTTRAEFTAFTASARHRVKENLVQIRERPDDRAIAVGEAVAGTPVVADSCPNRGWRRVALPDRNTGFVRARCLERKVIRASVSREGLASWGLRFLGVPYVWGGTTPKGFDCSGLVQRIFRLHGVVIPRDADQQARFGREKNPVEPLQLATGDLLFFGKTTDRITHVAMCLSNGLFVHARGHVRVNSLLADDPLFDEGLVGDWRGTRDPLHK